MPWLGSSELHAALGKIAEKADMASRAVIAESAALVVSKAQGNFEGVRTRRQSKTGKSWTVTPNRHVGGNKPNVITGFLRRSIKMTTIVKLGRGDYATKVGPDAIYARAVELKYKYPFFTPAVEDAALEFEAIRARIYREYLS